MCSARKEKPQLPCKSTKEAGGAPPEQAPGLRMFMVLHLQERKEGHRLQRWERQGWQANLGA